MANIREIEGIGDAYASQLEGVGVKTLDDLLDKGSSKAGRTQMAEQSGVSEDLILKWVNRADLARVKGIGGEYADLLEAAGVDSVPELALRVPENLHAKLESVNEVKNLVRRLPTVSEVAEWIEHAKSLDRAVTH